MAEFDLDIGIESSGSAAEGVEKENAPHSQNEFRALNAVLHALQSVGDAATRTRILKSAAMFFQVSLGEPHSVPPRPSFSNIFDLASPNIVVDPSPKQISAKEFLLEKQPRTDVERVACLAYYLTHYAQSPFFKTLDISKLNTEAAQPKFSNAAMAVDNATKSRYLVPAVKGQKQLSAMGELFVKALPDRDAAKSAMTSSRQRRKKRSGKNVDNSAGVAE